MALINSPVISPSSYEFMTWELFYIHAVIRIIMFRKKRKQHHVKIKLTYLLKIKTKQPTSALA